MADVFGFNRLPTTDDRLPAIWKQTAHGRIFPLTGFDASHVDLFGDVAESLARICRFGGHMIGNPYSVAQHCVTGADAAFAEHGDANLAAYVLLHDAHEYVFGDMTTPVARWLAVLAAELAGENAGRLVPVLIATAKERLDRAIWKAAGMAPPGRTYRALVADYDLRLLATERRQLLAPSPMSWGADVDAARPIVTRGALKAWPVARAVEEWRDRIGRFCPDAART
mgnify:CR=1 FL=1